MSVYIQDNRLSDGWAVEVRRESAYIHCPGVTVYEDGLIEIDYDDIPRMRAALGVIEEKWPQHYPPEEPAR